ncbi:MAG: hypothetical protein KF823_16185 [Xanthomonadales bacterium]|nr:hypothetical protein [Xanthomonadales bacterium]
MSRPRVLLSLLCLAALVGLGGCASRPVASDDGSGGRPGDAMARLAIPEQALDALPLEHLLVAEFALREENLDAAARAYLAAAQRSGDVQVARRATRINLSAQRWDDAALALARWGELGLRNTAEFRQAQAVLALGQGQGDRATDHLVELIQEGGMPATRMAAAALEAAPDRALSVQVLQRLVGHPSLPADRGVYIGLSQLALRLERNDLAESIAAQGSAKVPDAAELFFWRARLAAAAGRPDEARAVLAQAVAAQPDDLQTRRAQAVLLKTELDDADGALAILAALSQDDDTLALRASWAVEADDYAEVERVHGLLAALPAPVPAQRRLLMGGLAEALAAARETEGVDAAVLRWREAALADYQAVEADDDAELALRADQRIAVLEQQLGRLDEALARLAAQRDRLDPGDEAFAGSWLLESELLERAGDPARALAALDGGVAALPDDTRLRYARGLMRERNDLVEAALEDFRTLTEIEPDNPVFLNAYGYTLTDRTDRHEEALSLIERALLHNPDDVATIDSMGWVLYRLGRNEEALYYLQLAWEGQQDAEIGAHLGEVLWQLDRREEAREIWRISAGLDADNRTLQSTIRRLDP